MLGMCTWYAADRIRSSRASWAATRTSLQRTGAPAETREAANAKIVVIVDLDAGWTVEGERFRSFAGGLYPRPVRVRHEGSAAGVQFDLEPLAARALLGVPAGELRAGRWGSSSCSGARRGAGRRAPARRRRRRRRASRSSTRCCGGALAGARRRCGPTSGGPGRCCERSGGRMRVDELAAELGCSRRHLVNRFAADVGAPPKIAARLIRFERRATAARQRAAGAAGRGAAATPTRRTSRASSPRSAARRRRRSRSFKTRRAAAA